MGMILGLFGSLRGWSVSNEFGAHDHGALLPSNFGPVVCCYWHIFFEMASLGKYMVIHGGNRFVALTDVTEPLLSLET